MTRPHLATTCPTRRRGASAGSGGIREPRARRTSPAGQGLACALRGRGWWHCRQPGQVEVALEDGLSIVRLLGEHDLSTQQIVAAKLAALIEAGNPLVFDVTQATFIDSTVVNAVVRAGSALAARGVPVALVVPDSASRGVSKLIGLVEQKVAIVRSPAEAKQLLLSARQAD
jgi:anti-sigma B factor antagonist